MKSTGTVNARLLMLTPSDKGRRIRGERETEEASKVPMFASILLLKLCRCYMDICLTVRTHKYVYFMFYELIH